MWGAIGGNQRVTVEDLKVRLCQEWKDVLGITFTEDYWQKIANKLSSGPFKPALDDIFNALNRCKPDMVKCVIIGQDPYPTPGYAHGYSFSTNNGVYPKSLQNVFKELCREYSHEGQLSPNLEKWADDGVLLLNTMLTVGDKPKSHGGLWESFTQSVAEYIATHNISVFLCWGACARVITNSIEVNPDLCTVLIAGHPSPMNGKGTFAGCNHFVQCNDILRSKGVLPVRWLSIKL